MAIHDDSITIQGHTYGTARAKLRYTDLTAAATSQVLTFAQLHAAHPLGASTIPAEAVIEAAELVPITAFAGNSATTATVALGDAGDPDELITATDVFAAPGALTRANGALVLPAIEVTAYGAQVTFASDVNLGDGTTTLLTAGACELRIRYVASATDSRI